MVQRSPLYLQSSIVGASYCLNPQSGISEKAGAQWGAEGLWTDKRKTAFVISVPVDVSIQSSNCARYLFCEVVDFELYFTQNGKFSHHWLTTTTMKHLRIFPKLKNTLKVMDAEYLWCFFFPFKWRCGYCSLHANPLKVFKWSLNKPLVWHRYIHTQVFWTFILKKDPEKLAAFTGK